jgi:hypothetical protein
LRTASLAGWKLDQYDVDIGPVFGAGEHPAPLLDPQRFGGADPQVLALLQLFLDGDRVEPRVPRRRYPVLARLLEHPGVVGVAPGQIEDEVRGDAEPCHAGVVDRAAEDIAARGAGERGAGLVEHPRQMRVPLKLRPQWPRLGDCQVLCGRRPFAGSIVPRHAYEVETADA